MKKAIVTGANGFVGSTVVRTLLSHDVDVAALVHSNQQRNFVESDHLRVIPFELDNVGALEKQIERRSYDTFYHFAWKGGHASDRNNTQLQLQNAQWSVDCLRVAKELGCSRFVGVGTIMEFETYLAANAQKNRPGLGYIYGGSKLAAHALCKSIAADIGIDLVWGMLINAYGVGENAPRLINRTIRKIINGEPLEFTEGRQNYDFVYIDDAAEAFYLLGEKGTPFKNYMIGSGHARPLKEFLLEMQNAIAPETNFQFGKIKYTGVDIPLSVFSTDELLNDTGYIPTTSFKDGVVKTKKWLKNA